MSRLALLPALALLASPAGAQVDAGAAARWRAHAAATTIARDDWGIPHIKGTTDADAVFGMIYAQAEDDFPRIERNYLVALGRLSEAEGEKAIWQDLRQRLFMHEAALQRDYADAPAWLQRLMQAWADGLNFYLERHPQVQPRVLRRFEPWMALAFPEGSIGGDIEKIDLAALRAFYERGAARAERVREPLPVGSNGIAIAPAATRDGHALLLINPHTDFYFRGEQQVESDAGLNAYGAATWGQFFIYQGFNPHLGWMHTSSRVDAVDQFAETVERRDGKWMFRFGSEWRPVAARDITIDYRTADGRRASRRFTVFSTLHGPVIRAEGDKWISIALMQRPVTALSESFSRTKATSLASFMSAEEKGANSSNDTILATAEGDIAYFHAPFVPRRDARFDYRGVVDGSDPATDWHGQHSAAELPRVINPATGYVVNVNDSPWDVAGTASPKPGDFPSYVSLGGRNARTLHAAALLDGKRDWTLERLRDAAYDPALPAFDQLLPPLFAAWDALPASDPRKAPLRTPITLLRAWDRRWSATSEAMSIANSWGAALWTSVPSPANEAQLDHLAAMAAAPAAVQLAALDRSIDRSTRNRGGWRIAWGEINRFQRPRRPGSGFSDAEPSTPVPFARSRWGSLASFETVRPIGAHRRYGNYGNSFVAIVEFGPRVRAIAVMAGGQSGDPTSRHYGDQIAPYAEGRLRPVYFYPDERRGHIERQYHPGG